MISLNIFFASFAAAVALAQTAPPDACIQAQPSNQSEAVLMQMMTGHIAQSQTMAAPLGSQADFCFTAEAGKTYFYSRPDLGRVGIRFSVPDFNRVYEMSPSAESAMVTNMFIFTHELGHFTAHYLRRARAVVPGPGQSVVERVPSEALIRVLGQITRLEDIQELIDGYGRYGYTFASEAFADCYAGTVIGGGVRKAANQRGIPQADFYRFLNDTRVKGQLDTLMRRVVSIGSSVFLNGRVHGTPNERVSYVTYGMNLGDYYMRVPAANPEVRLALGAIYLCAINAYEAMLKHNSSPFEEALFPRFGNGY